MVSASACDATPNRRQTAGCVQRTLSSTNVTTWKRAATTTATIASTSTSTHPARCAHKLEVRRDDGGDGGRSMPGDGGRCVGGALSRAARDGATAGPPRQDRANGAGHYAHFSAMSPN